MVKKIGVILALLMTLGVAGQASAQGLTSEADIPGVTQTYSRTWSVDFEALMADATAMANLTNDPSAAAQAISATEVSFETENAAKDAVPTLKSQLDKAKEQGLKVEMEDVDGLGDEAIKLSIDMGSGMVVHGYAARSGDKIYITSAVLSDSEEADSVAKDLLSYILDHDPQTTDVTFNQDGTSTGGFFDRLPANDDAMLQGLLPQTDTQSTPAPGN